MTDYDPDANDVRDESMSHTTRRGLLGALGVAGLASLGSGGASAQLGCGPEADAMSEYRVPTYRVPESELDSPGVVGRRVEITAGGTNWAAGDQLVDTGTSWELVSPGYNSLSTGKVNNIEPWVVDGTSGGDIQDVIGAASAGDRVRFERANNSDGRYKTTEPIVIDKPLTSEGNLTVTGGEPHPDEDLSELDGVVIEQQTAGEDVIMITASGEQVDLSGLGLTWESSIRDDDTGHGINTDPPTENNSPGDGIFHSEWNDVIVDGHDGDHYAYRLLNPQHNVFTGLRAYGGGHHEIINDHHETNFGNSTFINPYVNIQNSGTAAGYHWVSERGSMNLCTYIRPQINHHGGSEQPVIDFTDNPDSERYSEVRTMQLYSADLEGPGTKPCNIPVGRRCIVQEAINNVCSLPAGVEMITLGQSEITRNELNIQGGEMVVARDGISGTQSTYEIATSDSQTLQDDSETKVEFSNGLETPYGWFDPSDHKFVVDREGDYRLSFQVAFDNGQLADGDEVRLRPYVNDSPEIVAGRDLSVIKRKIGTNRRTFEYPALKIHLNPGDEVEYYIRQKSGGTADTWGASALTNGRVELL